MPLEVFMQYAKRSMPPEARAERFVNGEARLTWTRLFFADFPSADIYLVGGTLRDVLLGRFPNDVDIVVRGVEPQALENWLRTQGAAEFVGRFGTFKFVPHGCQRKDPIDIALPRTEFVAAGHASGRSDMEVKFDHTLPVKEDLSRRDFTINAMAFDIRHGRLIDPFLGLRDLEDGILNAVLVPEQRFYEDASRMLRALRLASQLGFGIEAQTWQAICDNINLLNSISLREDGTHGYAIPREAIGKEFLLGFAEHPVHTLQLWHDCKALHLFMPQLAGLEGVADESGGHLYEKTLHALHLLTKPHLLALYGLKKAPPSVLVAALLAFLQDQSGKHAYEICTKLYFHQFPDGHRAAVDCNAVLNMVRDTWMFTQVDPASMRPSQFEKHFLGNRGRDTLLLMHAVFIANGSHNVARERLHTARKLRKDMTDALGDGLPRLINGEDIKRIGIEPGPHYRKLIDAVRDRQLAGKVRTREEALVVLHELVKKM